MKNIDQKYEYWNTDLSDEQKEKLDMDMIEELNNQFDEEDISQSRQQEKRKKHVLRFIAIITMISFTAIFAGFYFKDDWLPSFNAFSQSWELKQLPEIQSFQEAVVMIDTGKSKGTGFNIDADGLIVTNAHVVNDSEAVLVRFSQGDIYMGTQWISFPEVDLALIKIKGKSLPKLDLAEDRAVSPGDRVIIIGNPLGFPFMVSQGKVSGHTLLNNWSEPILAIEGYIYKGNSGSPVINNQGKVVGIVFAVSASQNNNEKVTGYAISVDSLNNRLSTSLD
ncbi:MAG: trypsin-like peptidase domain-containing protein [Dehalobacterium sp.]